MNEMTIRFNGQDYIAIYNSQTGYYELELTAPEIGGVYNADITFSDFWEEIYQDSIPIQVLAKEEVKVETNKVFMWIFDYKDFTVKDIVELTDYEINIDEETNASTIINVLKKTTAKARDIIVIKKNNDIVYWGTVDNVQNEDGRLLYQFITKYITNIFNSKIELKTTEENINTEQIEDGLYIFKYNENTNLVADVSGQAMENNAKVLAFRYTGGKNQFFGVIKQPNGYYKIMASHSHKYLTVDTNSFDDVVQYEEIDSDKQLWEIEKIGQNQYTFKSVYNDCYIEVLSNNYLRADSTFQIGPNIVFQLFKQSDEKYMQYIGVEDLIKRAIEVNFTKSVDTFINKDYITVEVKTHTPKQTSVSNVENGIYNLHTWMTNCTQNYDIVYSFSIVNKKLVITIENKALDKELIDIKAQAISKYNEVFETDVVSKVIVLYDKVDGLENKGQYILYLRTDRTTTTDMNDENRADGKVETIYTENYEDANQQALDVIKSNSYNHNITFNLYDKYIKVGTPIAIKTKESIILDTYISAVQITQNKFYEYTCGNIRIKFIDKLLKERRN